MIQQTDVTPTAEEIAALRAQIAALADREAIRALLDRYVVTLDTHDEKQHDDDWYRTIFTEDVRLEFPIGHYDGVEGLADFETVAKGKWERTHHLSSNCLIDLDGDRATVRAHVHAIHVHLPAAGGADVRPQPHFHVGGHYEIQAVRKTGGWRFRLLKFHIVWTDGPGLPSVSGGES